MRCDTLARILLVSAVAYTTGCAAIHPIRGVPVEQLMLESESRSDKATIDLSLLEQSKPDQYRVGPRDVLSVYVPGVLGRITDRDDEVGDAPPINQPQNPSDLPTVGFPLTVRDDGTLPLPQIRPVYVQGMTLGKVEEAIIAAYTAQTQVLNGERAHVIVSLARPREIEVLVVRQEKSGEVSNAAPNVVNVGRSRRGTARIVRLPAYKNDVLHALAKEQGVDGLPGLDAENTIYVIRRRNKGDAWPAALPHCQGGAPCNVGCEPCLGANKIGHAATPEGSLAEDAEVVRPVASSETLATSPGPNPQWQTQPALPAQSAHSQVPAMSPPQTGGFVPTGHATAPAVRKVDPFGTSRSMPNGMRGGRTPASGSPPQALPTVRGQNAGYRSSGGIPILPGHGLARGAVSQTSYYPAVPPAPVASPPQAATWGHGGMSTEGAPYVEGQPVDSYAGEVYGAEPSWREALADFDPTVKNPHVIKIPVRLGPGERPCFDESDIILDDGDVVFIESRQTEVFYTAGLLGGGQWELPRDYDLRLLEAIAIAQGPQNVQATGNNNGRSAINGDVTVSGSHVVILRTLPGGARVPISTSIYKAIKHPDEHNVKILPGDMIYLQYTCAEGILAFIERHLLETALFGATTGLLIDGN